MTACTGELWRSLASMSLRRETPKDLDALWLRGLGVAKRIASRPARFMAMAQRVIAMEGEFSGLSDAHLLERALELKQVFRARRDTAQDLLRAFAIVREAADRQLGQRPYPVQIAGALAIARGGIAEMATGEGKTLTATMPAVVAGWRGRGCHVLTVNDYLAERDARWMKPVYRALGLRVSSVKGESHPAERREAYAADITYCTNKEAAADFLRDRLLLRGVRSLASALLRRGVSGSEAPLDRLVTRGLECAIVDEADSILIDEAVTPLIIAGPAPNEELTDAYAVAASLAPRFEALRDYTLERRHSEVRLTREGRRRLEELAKPLGGVWAGRRRSEELLVQALVAREYFLRDKHYIVREDEAVIVDDFTGRLMPDRTWREGLHQAIEAKESLTVRTPKDTLARISFQRFFRLYRSLAGMTGTAAEEAGELWRIYRTPVVTIPTQKPCARVQQPDRVFLRAEEKWRAVANEVETVHREGRPVLIGARTIGQSEHLSRLLDERKLTHRLLNATRHEEEAGIVAEAGQARRITIATNMAGRGTDIRLGPGVAEMGGLHVIAVERHESRRVDRQLFGRAGRQGDPGSAVAIVSLEDELIEKHASTAARTLAKRLSGSGDQAPGPLAEPVFRAAQAAAQALAKERRRGVLRADDWLDDALGFTGSSV